MPSSFDAYEIGSQIGQGDMGTVYQATQKSTGETVALKLLDQFNLRSNLDRGAAVELVEFAASFKHDHLHPVLDVLESTEDNGKVGIVMPVAAMKSVWDFMNTGRKIPAKHCMRLINQLGSALQFLHGQEVAHGSIKPTNVLLDKSGNPTLTDLPMAHLREMGLVPKSMTALQQLYLPPETEFHAAPETRGDIFGLGVLGYHVLTGQMPFDDPDPEARGLPSRAGLPPLLFSVLLRAITHRVEWRYASIQDFMQDIEGAGRDEIDFDTKRLFTIKDEPPPEE